MYTATPFNVSATANDASDTTGSFSQEICSYKLCMLDIPGALAEDLGDLLLAEGATSISVEEYRPDNAPEEKIFANDPSSEGLKRVWERCSVVSYFPPDFNNADAVVVAAAAALGLSTSDFCRTLEEVRAQDWEAAIKESYQPVRVADGLWIVPTWCDAAKLQDNSWSKEKNVNLILEPGLAFGTGDHPTTRLCLKWLQALHIKTNMTTSSTNNTNNNSTIRVMDYGTGSGVLAVAALLLGATTAIGTDVEHLAVRSAAQNAALNNVNDRFTALQCGADLNAPEPMEAQGYPVEERLAAFQIVVANILRGPLVELAPRLAQYAAPGAVLGLSGILETQAPEVIEAYGFWFEDFEVKTEESWALVTGRRKK
ncbi:hypothetical protein Ndes2437A_g06867 [Nannochloris sp. 'desiccata']